jgi:hypothetical protein
MIEQSFEFKATVEAAVGKMEAFAKAFPAALGKQLSNGHDLGKATCKEARPREGEKMWLGVTIEAGEEKVEGAIAIEFAQHASGVVARGKFTWHAAHEIVQGSRLVAAMEKESFVKVFQKRVAAAIQEALVAAGCAPAGTGPAKAGACTPGQQAAKPISCPRCGYSIQPGTAKQGRCPYCKVKL